MDRRDQDFLNKQMRHIQPSPRGNGTIILGLVAVFLAGVTLGALMFDYQAASTQTAERTRMAMLLPAAPMAR